MKRVLIIIVLSIFGIVAVGQTYFYVENISLTPPNPTETDIITMVVSGNLSGTDIVVTNGYLIIIGNTVHVYFDVMSTGIGLTVLVPYSHTFTLGPLSAGNYSITINGNFVGDYVPANQKVFTVTGNVPECNAFFTFYPDTVSPPPLSMDLFQFVDQSSGNNIISWYWDFGDGVFSTDQNPQHGYFNMIPAQYIVCLTILTSDSCTDTYCDTVYINQYIPDCDADFIYELDTLVNCINCYDFYDQSFAIGNIISWFWDFGDGNFSTDQNPIHQFSQTGLFEVCLTIITDDSCSDVSCQTVVVGDTSLSYCQTDFSYTLQGSAIPEIIYAHFTDESNSNPGISSWFWDFGDGNTSTLQNPTNNYWLNNWGLNTVCLTIATTAGCVDSICKPVYVGYDPCLVSLNYVVSDVTIPGGSNGEISLNISGGSSPYQFFWSDGSTNQNLINIPAGTYVVWVVDAANCLLNDVIEVSETISFDIQNIELPPGWSIFSTYIDPVDPNIATVLQGLADTVIIAKNGAGLVYWPMYNINAIGNITIGEGYQLKLSGITNYYLNVEGVAVIPENVILFLPQGWSIIGYLRQIPGNISLMLAPLVSPPGTTGVLDIVKDDLGNVYWPYFGLNIIGNMMPGEGYQLRLNSAVNFSYPAN